MIKTPRNQETNDQNIFGISKMTNIHLKTSKMTRITRNPKMTKIPVEPYNDQNILETSKNNQYTPKTSKMTWNPKNDPNTSESSKMT